MIILALLYIGFLISIPFWEPPKDVWVIWWISTFLLPPALIIDLVIKEDANNVQQIKSK